MSNLMGIDQFKNNVRKLEATDLAVPDTWNPIHQDLINNDVHLETTKASITTTITGTGGLTGGGDLSANRTISIAASGVTDAMVGNRTISDATAPTGDTSVLTTLLGWLANMIKAITGGATWRTAPATTLAAASTHMGATAAGTHGSTSAATANMLMHRDANGRAQVAAPSAAADIARKDTVDTHAALTAAGTHGSATAATANTLMHRDANGRSQVAAPAAAADIARKDTVDAVQTNLTNHTGAAAGAHAATAISNTPAGGIAATTVQAALNELDLEKVGRGATNQTVELITALFQQIDTRSWTATTWNSDNQPTHIDIKDGATVLGTLDLTWNTDMKPTQIIAVAGGKTVTYTITWLAGPKFVSITKAVV